MKKFYDRNGKVYKTERYFRDNSINSVQVIEEVTQKEMLSYISNMECFDDENNNVVILYKNGKVLVLDSDVYRNIENIAEAIEEATAKAKRFCKRDIAAIINSNENTTIVYGRYYITDSGVVEPMTAEEQTEHYTFAENIEEVEAETAETEAEQTEETEQTEAEQEQAEAEATAAAEQAAAIENLISFDSKHNLCKEIVKLTTGINLLIYDLHIDDNNLISNSDVYNTAEIFEKLKKYSDDLLDIAEYTNRLLFDYFKLPYFAEAEQEQTETAEQENF